MASGKKLGFFWGEQSFRIVETENNIPARVITIPLAAGPEGEGVAGDDIRLTALIQKTVREERITSGPVKLCIPSGDTIIRSFVIPAMRPNEVGHAVEFEVKKYIPFSLKELAYSYHPVAFTENKVKKFRIVFVAVRKDLLERYTRVLEQAGLNVVFSEAEPLSLVRALTARKLIPHDQKIAVMQLEATVGRILFTQEGVVPFIREFHLNTPQGFDITAHDPQAVKSRFLNEVHNSLDFYTRQYSQQGVSQVVVFSAPSENTYSQWLQEDLTGVAVKSVDPASIAGTQQPGDEMGAVNAFGVSMAHDGGGKVVFDLSRKTIKHASAYAGGSSIDILEYMKAVKTAVVCGVILLGIFIWTQAGLSGLKGSVEQLKAEQGSYSDMTAEDIKTKIKKGQDKITSYKSIPLKSDILSVYARVTALLPDGVWLKGFNVMKPADSVEKGWMADISGYVYMPEPSQEMRIANELVVKIKKNKQLAKYFKSVTLTSLQQLELEGRIVVYFVINCK